MIVPNTSIQEDKGTKFVSQNMFRMLQAGRFDFQAKNQQENMEIIP